MTPRPIISAQQVPKKNMHDIPTTEFSIIHFQSAMSTQILIQMKVRNFVLPAVQPKRVGFIYVAGTNTIVPLTLLLGISVGFRVLKSKYTTGQGFAFNKEHGSLILKISMR